MPARSEPTPSAKKIFELIAARKLAPAEGLALLKRMESARGEPVSGAERARTASESAEGAGRSAARVVRAEGGAGEERRRETVEIAVIGLSGRFPGARNVEEYWANLAAGRGTVAEVPAERWDMARHFDPDPAAPNKSYGKWGGFLADAAEFDPLFFSISPREAEQMDPQQRLILQEVWRALEDAGCSPDDLEEAACSVFIGCKEGDYQHKLRGAEADSFTMSGGNLSILAARISYFLNLRGPCMPVDTACSSSLVALDLACETLRKGTCRLAIAGGVSLMTTPGNHIVLSKTKMLSPAGRCATFDQGADGFVPGEGVGVVILKRLEDALRDRDHIHGVIKGTGVNQDGKTNGITAPSGPAQTALATEVYTRHGIDPASIGYVEAHGTGTKLGDPIEVDALGDAFRKFTPRRQFCAIGSVKTNIGHTLEAAGMASLIKVLLCLRHGRIVPTLNFTRGNEHIDFASGPFFVATEAHEWRPTTAGGRRRAAISAFGFSGTNAHVVVEEAPPEAAAASSAAGPEARRRAAWPVALSAQTAEALRERRADLLAWVRARTEAGERVELADVAFTLLRGRRHFPVRWAAAVEDLAGLTRALEEAEATVETRSEVEPAAAKAASARARGLVAAARTERSALAELAREFVAGATVDWAEWFAGLECRRVPLPVYPFARERYWVEERPANARSAARSATAGAVGGVGGGGVGGGGGGGGDAKLHPLLGRNVSTWDALEFSTELSGAEFFLADHRVAGRATLPGVAILEMARAAAELVAPGRPAEGVEGVMWGSPVVVDGAPVTVALRLYPEGGALAFELVTAATERLHAQGRVRLAAGAGDVAGGAGLGAGESLDVAAIRSRCGRRVEGEALYRDFAERGLGFGRRWRGLREVWSGEGEALARLELPAELRAEPAGFGWHPVLLDGAWQALVALVGGAAAADGAAGAGGGGGLWVPFALDELVACGGGADGGVFPAGEALAHVTVAAREGEAVAEGVRYFDVVLARPDGVVALRVKGLALRAWRMEAALASPSVALPSVLVEAPAEGGGALGEIGQREAEAFFKTLLSRELKVPPERLVAREPLERYGIDSMLVMNLTRELETQFGELPKTLFFEHRSIAELATYFLTHHRAALLARLGAGAAAPVPAAVVERAAGGAEPLGRRAGRRRGENRGAGVEDIAIVGVSGRYPMADDLDEFWANLLAGRNCITEIPAERWDAARDFDTDKTKPGAIYAKWGGFLNGVDRFDAAFFNISPREAQFMDPQERLFLETVWHTLENAGYSRRSLAGGKVGVFVGVMYGHYQLYGAEESLKGRNMALGSSYASIANRVSYTFDFQGPSLAVDTMCSSSLTSIHLACESLRRGESDVAVAGGVNVTIHPNKYVLLSQGRFASSDGLCRSFGEGGDGYVPGEGVGAVLLKRLRDAEADGDHIHAVIKGSAVNHGGKTNGYTVPNPQAQAEVIGRALKEARVDPRELGYLEAHGTGTSLGDPIELAGLTAAFRRHTSERRFCAIGSVKSNIGHAESAAGISGVTKVLLQMRHGRFAPSLHAETPNPHLNFADSPFVLQREGAAWPRTRARRMAGVSSFGAGGANAHLLLAEHVGARETTTPAAAPGGPQVVVLSARTAGQLRAVVERLARFLAREASSPAPTLERLAHTLQVGREAMEERWATVVGGLDELRERLSAWLERGAAERAVFTGRVANPAAGEADPLLDGPEGEAFVRTLIAERKAEKLARLWVRGAEPDWARWWGDAKPGRTPLPEYPFERKRFWVPRAETGADANGAARNAAGNAGGAAADADGRGGADAGGVGAGGVGGGRLHAFLGENVSTLEGQAFAQTFGVDDAWVRDHRVGGRVIVPGVMLLEMARAAGGRSWTGGRVAELRGHRWLAPLEPATAGRVRVELAPSETDAAEAMYRIVAEPVVGGAGGVAGGAERVIAEGVVRRAATKTDAADVAEPTGADAAEALDLAVIGARCAREVAAATVYAGLAAAGIEHGPGLRALERVWLGEGEALAELARPAGAATAGRGVVLDPALADAALQALGVLVGAAAPAGERFLPAEVEALEIGATEWPGRLRAHIREAARGAAAWTFDLVWCDEGGRVLARMRGLTLRRAGRARAAALAAPAEAVAETRTQAVRTQVALAGGDADGAGLETLLLTPEWVPAEPPEVSAAVAGDWVLIGATDVELTGWRAAVGGRGRVLELRAGRAFERVGDTAILRMDAPEDFVRLAGEWTEAGARPRFVVNLLARKRLVPNAAVVSAQVRRTLGVWFHWVRAWAGRAEAERQQLFQVEFGADGQVVSGAMAGWFKALAQENPRFVGRTLGWGAELSPEALPGVVVREAAATGAAAADVRFDRAAVRMRRGLRELRADEIAGGAPAWREGGRYLVTGGLGGLGLIVAAHLARSHRARVVLAGRREASAESAAAVARIEAAGGRAIYVAADVSEAAGAARAVAEAERVFGGLDGVVHSAGVLRDGFVRTKTEADMAAVLRPKLDGALALDRATARLGLDCFVLFGSTSGVMGNAGQTDYAFANAFLDRFAAWREGERRAGRRAGRTVAIDWPYWRDGGMAMDARVLARMETQWGLYPLENDAGLAAGDAALRAAGAVAQVMVLRGRGDKLRPPLGLAAAKADAATVVKDAEVAKVAASAAMAPDGVARTVAWLKGVFAEVTGLSAAEVGETDSWEKFGLDSVMVTAVSHALEKRVGPVAKTLLFEHANIAALAEHLAGRYVAAVVAVVEDPEAAAPVPELAAAAMPARAWPTGRGSRAVAAAERGAAVADIAIVGVSGRYPQAESLEEFWCNLREGRDCITEVPAERWDHRKYYDPDRSRLGKSYAKWGGFLRDIDAFDPLFFGIAPREADFMDPQERLFLQACWHALEDAGVTRAVLAAEPVGVFVGVMYSQYQLWYDEESGVAPGGSHASIANRVSHVFDFHGPSLAVDTMCSSSLTAIHLACESIRRGECAAALAGGVNLTLHPNKYIQLSYGRFASTDGRCRSFGAGGDGYVPGEGVGGVLLKPLARALADGDRIQGVLKGGALNHGGRTHGYTVPNPRAQAEVIGRALKQARWDARDLSYIEAHGTGTALGDPIEIAGLRRAFEAHTKDRGFCAIGSAKSNIGHLESAAGIAGLTKVLLQFAHGELAPTLHAEPANPDIDFAASPFVVQKTVAPWRRSARAAGDGGEGGGEGGAVVPRRAGVSSFGAGGANAHLLVEEWTGADAAAGVGGRGAGAGEAELWVLSARTPERLRAQAERLLEFLSRPEAAGLEPAAVAWTLQIGREAMEARLAWLAASVAEAVERLRAFLAGELAGGGLFTGLVKARRGPDAPERAGGAVGEDRARIAARWVAGAEVDWAALRAERPRRVALPGYAFARERHWVPLPERGGGAGGAAAGGAAGGAPGGGAAGVAGAGVSGAAGWLHPLLGRNVSTLREQAFETVLAATRPWLADHVVAGRAVLPGAVVLEMAGAAGALALGADVTVWEDVAWLRPAVVDEARGELALRLVLRPTGGGAGAGSDAAAVEATRDAAAFELFSVATATGARVALASGRLRVGGGGRGEAARGDGAEVLDLVAWRDGLAWLGGREELAAAGRRNGIVYGPAFLNLVELRGGPERALARYRLAESHAAEFSRHRLHPALVDAAFQAVAGVGGGAPVAGSASAGSAGSAAGAGVEVFLPAAVKRIEWLAPLTAEGFVAVRLAGGDEGRGELRFDLTLTDTSGRAAVRMTGFLLKKAARVSGGSDSTSVSASAAAGRAASEPARGGGGARAELVEQVRRLVAEELRLAPERVDPEESFDRYGLDSVMVMRLTERLEQRFGKLAPAVFFEHPTVAALAGYLAASDAGAGAAGRPEADAVRDGAEAARDGAEAGLAVELAAVEELHAAAGGDARSRFPGESPAAAGPSSELVPIQPLGGRTPSFWVHGLPGFAQGFRRLAQILGPDFPVYAFQARGVDGRRMPFLSVPEMAAHYVACMRELRPRGPYFIGGQSSGGLIAYEMARQLQAAGERVGHVVMLDTYPPTAEMGERFRKELPDEIGLLAIANLFLRYGDASPSPITPEELRAVPDGLRVGYLVRRILAAGTTMSADWLYNHLQGAREVTEFTGEAIRTYQAQPYTGSPVTYFRSNGLYAGADNTIALPERGVFEGFDYVRPWRELVGERLGVVELEGDHFGLLEEPNHERIRETLCNILPPAGFS